MERGLMARSKADELEEIRERRYVLKDILNTNLLAPEARKHFEREYEETGRILAQAVPAAT
jgi:hypothetical protein